LTKYYWITLIFRDYYYWALLQMNDDFFLKLRRINYYSSYSRIFFHSFFSLFSLNFSFAAKCNDQKIFIFIENIGFLICIKPKAFFFKTICLDLFRKVHAQFCKGCSLTKIIFCIFDIIYNFIYLDKWINNQNLYSIERMC